VLALSNLQTGQKVFGVRGPQLGKDYDRVAA
jgi:hypothetical protein